MAETDFKFRREKCKFLTSGGALLNERDVTTQWRKLFTGQEITDAVLSTARALLNRLSPESPLRIRLAMELDEIKKLRQKN